MCAAYLWFWQKRNNDILNESSVVEAGSVKIYSVFDKPSVIKRDKESTAEDLCISLCNKYNIPPLTRTLFALRVRGTNLFLKDNSIVLQGSRKYEFRIRFKVPRISQLTKMSEKTFDYYFQQARNDVNENKIPEIKFPEHRSELLGLGITDMIRAILEHNLRLQDVIKDYTRHIPAILVKHYGSYCQDMAKRDLPLLICKLSDFKCDYVKTQYLQQLYALAPNYLAEEYDDVIWENGENNVPVQLMVSPFHPQEAGIRLFNTMDRTWSVVCSIEELIYLTRSEKPEETCYHFKLEVSRGKTSVFFLFKSEEQLSSFISVCSGYYRLMVKWTFNLSKDDETPSLKELHRIKCHGPVGGAFAHRKLEEKTGRRHGSFILRECEEKYNYYNLDYCTASGTIDICKIEFNGETYKFLKFDYTDIDALIAAHTISNRGIYLNKNYHILPSEYDKSQLLLCAQPKTYLSGEQVRQADLPKILSDKKTPYCLSVKDIFLIHDQDIATPLFHGSGTFRTGGFTETRKAEWKLDETNKKIFVVHKELKQDKSNDYLKDFIELGNKWSSLQSNSVVRLYGVTFNFPPALILEYIPLGRFDEYLRKEKDEVTLLQLKKAAVGLARALWDLSEGGVVHGFIRCERLLLSVQDGDRLVVKLSGPSLRQYTPQDLHWIPIAFFDDFNQARKSVLGDIWAFATTLWEIFSYGQSPAEPPTSPILTQSSYKNNDRLMRPKVCPEEVWTIISKCWQPNPPRPQEILRDLNHMLHNDYIPVDNKTDGAVPFNKNTETSDNAMVSDDNVLSKNSSLNQILSINYQNITYQVLILNGQLIGKGNYGSVYKGEMWNENQQSKQTRYVAVKKLDGGNDSHRKEFDIMRRLTHANIVQILGYSSDRHSLFLVMEYVEEGCLYNYLKFNSQKLRNSHFIKYAKDIANGMEYISANDICHCDLATRNVLVVNVHNVKISDFGLAQFNRGARRVELERDDGNIPAISKWYPPESVVRPYVFTTASDVWAYGVTVWEIFTRAQAEVPNYNSVEERASVFTLPEGCPSDIYRRLMQDCWQVESASRPTFRRLVEICEELASIFRDDPTNI